jgi:hypothetical protein
VLGSGCCTLEPVGIGECHWTGAKRTVVRSVTVGPQLGVAAGLGAAICMIWCSCTAVFGRVVEIDLCLFELAPARACCQTLSDGCALKALHYFSCRGGSRFLASAQATFIVILLQLSACNTYT